MNRLLYFLCLSLLFSAIACSSGGADTETADAVEEPLMPPAAPPAPADAAKIYEPIPVDRLEYLFYNCDYIDYVFYQTNFSLSQSEKEAIQATLVAIGADAPVIDPSCQPIGRIFFQVDGQNAEEADIYLSSQQCLYYIWMEDGKPAYANVMTEQAVKFYANVFQQVQQGAPQQ